MAKSYVKPAGGLEETDTEIARQWLVAGHPLRNGTLEGLVPDRGAVSETLPVNGSYTIPQGYHNGAGQVTQSLPYKTAGEHATGSGLNTQGLYYYFEPGYYETDGTNAWIYRTRAEIASTIGLTAADLRKGATVLDIAGAYAAGSVYMQGFGSSGTVTLPAGNYVFVGMGCSFSGYETCPAVELYVDGARRCGVSTGRQSGQYNGADYSVKSDIIQVALTKASACEVRITDISGDYREYGVAVFCPV